MPYAILFTTLTITRKIQHGLGEKFMNDVVSASEEVSTLPLGYESRYKNTREKIETLSAQNYLHI